MTTAVLQQVLNAHPDIGSSNSLDDSVNLYRTLTGKSEILNITTGSGKPINGKLVSRLFSAIVRNVVNDLDEYFSVIEQEIFLSNPSFLYRGVKNALRVAPEEDFFEHALPFILMEMEGQYLDEHSGTSEDVLDDIEAKRRFWHAMSDLPDTARRVMIDYSGFGRTTFERGLSLDQIASKHGMLPFFVEAYFEQGRELLSLDPDLQHLNKIYELKRDYEEDIQAS